MFSHKTPIILLLPVIFYSVFSLQAQDKETPQETNSLKNSLRLGLNYYAGEYFSSSSHISKVENKNIPIGVFIEYKLATYNISRFFLKIEYSTVNKHVYSESSNVNLETESFAFSTGADFHYLRWKRFSLYSGISIGIGLYSAKIKVSTSTQFFLDDIISSIGYEGSIVLPIFQFKILGGQLELNDNFGVISELSVGMSTAANLGIATITLGLSYNL